MLQNASKCTRDFLVKTGPQVNASYLHFHAENESVVAVEKHCMTKVGSLSSESSANKNISISLFEFVLRESFENFLRKCRCLIKFIKTHLCNGK